TAQSTHQQPAIGSPAWIRIPASDVPRAQKFYQEVFGWKFHDHSKEGYAVNKLAVFTIPGAPTLMGGIGKSDDAERKDGGMVLYMKVESVEETLDKAKSADGEVVKEKWVEGGHTEMGEFRDTEGNLVGVLKWL
ncbi:Glyoxalase/Bleomycin resistance protein/Dihydroxybiphenyl dioxygenase, partial [Hyaloscypha bicolor E]